MWRVSTIALAICVLLVSCRMGLPYSDPGDQDKRQSSVFSGSPIHTLSDQPHLAGALPVIQVLERLRAMGLLDDLPPLDRETLGQSVACLPGDDAATVITNTEIVINQVYDAKTRTFVQPQATDPIDAPDGCRATANVLLRAPWRRRPCADVRIRFYRVDGSANLTFHGSSEIEGGGEFHEADISVPSGVQYSWSSQTVRSYTDSVTSVQTGLSTSTTRETVPAGLSFSGLVGLCPGGVFRMNGQLSVSSFTDSSVDTSTVSVPCYVDGFRWRWLEVLRIRDASASAFAALSSLGFGLQGSGSDIVVLIRVD